MVTGYLRNTLQNFPKTGVASIIQTLSLVPANTIGVLGA